VTGRSLFVVVAVAAGALVLTVISLATGSGQTPLDTTSASKRPASGPPPEIVVTRDRHGRALPRGCRPRSVALRLQGLGEAVTGNRPPGLRRAFAAQTRFRVFAIGYEAGPREQRQFFSSRDLRGVSAYFKQRARHNERWRLLTVRVNRQGKPPQSVGIEPFFARSASDARFDEEVVAGKGVLTCPSARIVLASLVIAQPLGAFDPATKCPQPAAGRPSSVVIACS
jgi:hypothetical protein